MIKSTIIISVSVFAFSLFTLKVLAFSVGSLFSKVSVFRAEHIIIEQYELGFKMKG